MEKGCGFSGMFPAPRPPMDFGEAVERVESALFVGRVDLIARLVALVGEAKRAPRIAVIVGPAGAGKSALAREVLRRLPRQRAIWLSGERITPNVESFRAAVSAESAAGLEGLGRGDAVDLLVIDACERLESVARWLFADALPRAGARLCVVVTSRERASAREQGPLAAVMHELVLPPLDDSEARDYLRRREVPESALDAIVAHAAGHALALRLIADRYLLDRGYRFEAHTAQDLFAPLLAEIVRDAPSVEHECALHALAVAPTLDEQLLGAMLDLPAASVSEMFWWLRSLTFVEQHVEGLIPHPLIRAVLHGDLAQRHPERLRSMLARTARETAPNDVLPVDLTERQRAVLGVLLSGKSNKEIAVALRCAESTVEFHVTALLRKNRVTSRTELIAKLLATSDSAPGTPRRTWGSP